MFYINNNTNIIIKSIKGGSLLLIIGTGIDIIEISRIQQAVEHNDKFIQRCFTENEYAYFISRRMRYEVIAGNFAAKEAFSKSLGTGIRDFELKEIEVLRDRSGRPYINLYGKALNIVKELGIEKLHVTISHCREYAVASVIAEKLCRPQ